MFSIVFLTRFARRNQNRIITYSRLLRKLCKHGEISGADQKNANRRMNRIAELTGRLDALAF